jgi:hypothetical protein
MIKWIGRYIGFLNVCLIYFLGALIYDIISYIERGKSFISIIIASGIWLVLVLFLSINIKTRVDLIKNGNEPKSSNKTVIVTGMVLVIISIMSHIMEWGI